MDRAKVVEDFELRVGEIGELDLIAFFENGDAVLFSEVTFGVERLDEAKIAEAGFAIWERNATIGGAVGIDEEYV